MTTIVEGERLKNKSTQYLYRIKTIENEKVVMLEDEKGLIRLWFPESTWDPFSRR